MDLSSFLTSLGTSFLVFLFLMLCFAMLSKMSCNQVIYYPNRILKGLDPFENTTRNPFTWIKETFSATEDDIISMSSVDTAVYFVFLSTALGIFVLSGVVLLPILMSVSVTEKAGSKGKGANTSNGTFHDLDKLSMGNIKEKSSRLWAYVFACYWVTFVTFYMLWRAYKHVSELRAAALGTTEVKPEQFAVVVRDIPDIPEGQTRKEQVDLYFKTLHPDTFYGSLLVTDSKEVFKMWEELQGYQKKLARAEAIFEASKETSKPEGIRPTNRTGFLGLLGAKVDTIEYYTKEIDKLVPKLEAEQKNTLKEKQESSAIVFFNSRLAAVSAAQTLHPQKLDTWTIIEAPEPRQILWSNLKKKFYERKTRQNVVYFIVTLTVLFYMVPIGFISAMTTLKNLQKLLPFLKPVVNQPALKTVLEAYLPQLALIVFLALLPTFLMMLSKAEGIASKSHAVRATSGKYFYFIVFNVFLGVTLGGTLFDTLKIIEKDPKWDSAITILGEKLPDNATFFLTFVALRFFIGYGLELSRLIPLIVFHLKKKFLCKTEMDVKDAWAPLDINYATRIPNDMLIVTVTLCYSVLTPLIIPFGALYFAIGWLVMRNQALKVYVPTYESNGRMWPHTHKRILTALLIFQLTMIGYFGIKRFVYAPILLILPILTFMFYVRSRNKFFGGFRVTPLEVVSKELKESPDMQKIVRAYIPNCLSSDKFKDAVRVEDALFLFGGIDHYADV